MANNTLGDVVDIETDGATYVIKTYRKTNPPHWPTREEWLWQLSLREYYANQHTKLDAKLTICPWDWFNESLLMSSHPYIEGNPATADDANFIGLYIRHQLKLPIYDITPANLIEIAPQEFVIVDFVVSRD